MSDVNLGNLCIITAEPSDLSIVLEELRNAFSQDFESCHDEDHFTGTWRGFTVHIMSCSRGGVETFAIEATHLMGKLRPKYALHVGICAGKEKNDQIKVVFSSRALNYEEGKMSSGHGSPSTYWSRFFAMFWNPDPAFLPAYQSWSRGISPAAWVEIESGHQDWKCGGIVTVAAFRKDTREIIENIQKHVHRKTIAVDKEGSAFLHVCDHLGVTSLGIIKGVTDHGDQNEYDQNREPALRLAAQALAAWVSYYIPPL